MRTPAVLAVLALCLATASSALSAPARPLETWGARASAICEATERSIARIPSPGSIRGFAVALPELIAAGTRERRLIAALPRPAAQREQIAAYLASYPPLFGVLTEMIAASKAADTAAFDALLKKGSRLSRASDRIARALGATACAG